MCYNWGERISVDDWYPKIYVCWAQRMKPFSSVCWLCNLEVLCLSNVMSYLRFEFCTSNGFPKSPSRACQRPRPVSFSILSLHIPMYLSDPSENWGVSLPTGDGWSLVGNVHDCSCYCYCEVRMRRGERGGRGVERGEGRGERWGERGVEGHNYGIKILGGDITCKIISYPSIFACTCMSWDHVIHSVARFQCHGFPTKVKI